MASKKKLYHFSATMAGDWWPVKLGHVVTIDGVENVVSGWLAGDVVWLARGPCTESVPADKLFERCGFAWKTDAEIKRDRAESFKGRSEARMKERQSKTRLPGVNFV